MNKKLTLYKKVFLAFYNNKLSYYENKLIYRTSEVMYFNPFGSIRKASLYVPYVLIDLETRGYIITVDTDYPTDVLNSAQDGYFRLTSKGFHYGKNSHE